MQQQDISVEIVLATRGHEQTRNGLITFLVNVPLFVWTELLTHKRIARNAASARAMGVQRYADQGVYIPPVFYEKGAGMQVGEALDRQAHLDAVYIYERAAHLGRLLAEALDNLGVCKEQANRVIPPFVMKKAVMTATEDAWSKLLELRHNPTADTAMQRFAAMVQSEMNKIIWNISSNHIPFHEHTDPNTFPECFDVAAARIARCSYGTPKVGKSDLELAQQLKSDNHLSPFEHIAYYDDEPLPSALCCKEKDLHRSCYGWTNYRAWLEQVLPADH